MFVFEAFEPGKLIGRRTLVLERELVEQWLTLFPADRDGDTMPPGMMAAVCMWRAFVISVWPGICSARM